MTTQHCTCPMCDRPAAVADWDFLEKICLCEEKHLSYRWGLFPRWTSHPVEGCLKHGVAVLRTTKEGEPWTAPPPNPSLIGVINKGYKSPKRAAKEGGDGT